LTPAIFSFKMRYNRFAHFLRRVGNNQSHNFRNRALGVAVGSTVVLFLGQTAYAADMSGKQIVFSWGAGQYGQIGYGGERDVSAPLQLTELDENEIVFLSAGGQQSAALTSKGQVFTWGRAQDKRLGHGPSDGSNESYPRQVDELRGENIVYIDAGFLHMACVNDKGEVFTWGKNSSKQLGHPKSDYPMKAELPEGSNIVQVACGRNHTLALTDDGMVYAWGGTKTGAQGTGKKGSEPKPTLVHAVADENIIQIAAGEDFSLFLSSSGKVFSCGASDFGQTGQGRSNRYTVVPTHIHNLRASINRIACGQYHAVAISDIGEVYTWGFNKDGGLGHGDNFHRHTPSRVVFGVDSVGTPTDCAAGGGHTAVVFDEGKTVYIFGRGRSGQIGRADEIESVAAYRSSPVEVKFFKNSGYSIQQVALGSDHSMLLTKPVSGK